MVREYFPVEMFWDAANGVMRPTGPFWLRKAQKQFGDGEVFPMVPADEASTANRNFYFACVNRAWKNLPENLQDRFPSDDHLRYYALIKTGWHTQSAIVAGSNAGALKLAAWGQTNEPFVVIEVVDNVVTKYTARSQKMNKNGGMSKDEFRQSSDDVLNFISNLLGVRPEELTKAVVGS